MAIDAQAAPLQAQLADLQAVAAQRHQYIDNVARPSLMSQRNWSVLGGGGFAGLYGGVLTAIPEAIAKRGAIAQLATWLGAAEAGPLIVAAAGAAGVVAGGIAWYNAPSVDQIDQAIAQSHANVDADCRARSAPIEDQLRAVTTGRAGWVQQANSAKSRVDTLENLLREHDPPIPFTPCGGTPLQ